MNPVPCKKCKTIPRCKMTPDCRLHYVECPQCGFESRYGMMRETEHRAIDDWNCINEIKKNDRTTNHV